jgi:hypothetical protein
MMQYVLRLLHASPCIVRPPAAGRLARSRAEGHLVVAVATAPMVLGVIAGIEVGVGAARGAAVQVLAVAAGEVHGQVVPVDHGDVVVVVGPAAADGELGQRQGRLPGQGARERAAAVARRAAAAAGAVEGAAGAAPDPAGLGASGHLEGPRLARVELPAAAHGGGRRPHCVAAVVFDGEGCRAGAGGEGREEEQEDRGGGGRGRH